jgi:hypothetical protein
LFDPFEDPFRTWPGRNVLLSKLQRDNSAVNSYLSAYRENNMYRSATPWGSSPPPPTDVEDPFNVKLAPPGLVFGVLVLVLVVAVPLNFLVLGKLRRKELAWTTLPILSIVFSGAIFATTGGLYSAKAARLTNGVLLVHDGLDTGVFIGRQQLFFPRAGRFDLGFHDVEAAVPPNRFESFGLKTQSQTPDLIDIGQVVSPALEVPNLAFREYSLIQGVDTNWRIGIDVKLLGADHKGCAVDIKNQSPIALRDSRLFVNGFVVPLGDIPPGSTKHFEKVLNTKPNSSWAGGAAPPVGTSLALEAKATLAVGSTHGNDVASRSDSRILYTWGKDVGQ